MTMIHNQDKLRSCLPSLNIGFILNEMLWLRRAPVQTLGLQVKFKVIIHYLFSEAGDSRKKKKKLNKNTQAKQNDDNTLKRPGGTFVRFVFVDLSVWKLGAMKRTRHCAHARLEESVYFAEE